MAHLQYIHPAALNGRSFFGGHHASLDRLRTLLLLTGQGAIVGAGRTTNLATDFMTVPSQPAGSFRIATLLSKVPSCTRPQLNRLVADGATKNIRIHKNIFNEALHCLYHYETKQFIASFVHLYRLIEHAALYLPFISIVAGSNDLTFTDYKQVIENKAKADLSVLKKFSRILLDPNIRISTVHISFATHRNPTMDCDVAKSVLDGGFRASGSDWIEMEYGSLDRLIVGLRNEFFHYLYHEENISLDKMQDPDEFLGACMPSFISYFAFLYREFLIAEWELWS